MSWTAEKVWSFSYGDGLWITPYRQYEARYEMLYRLHFCVVLNYFCKLSKNTCWEMCIDFLKEMLELEDKNR